MVIGFSRHYFSFVSARFLYTVLGVMWDEVNGTVLAHATSDGPGFHGSSELVTSTLRKSNTELGEYTRY